MASRKRVPGLVPWMGGVSILLPDVDLNGWGIQEARISKNQELAALVSSPNLHDFGASFSGVRIFEVKRRVFPTAYRPHHNSLGLQ